MYRGEGGGSTGLVNIPKKNLVLPKPYMQFLLKDTLDYLVTSIFNQGQDKATYITLFLIGILIY